jgi:hypothetical protein
MILVFYSLFLTKVNKLMFGTGQVVVEILNPHRVMGAKNLIYKVLPTTSKFKILN